MAIFREAVHQQYATDLGKQLADLSASCDERAPFGRGYATDAICY